MKKKPSTKKAAAKKLKVPPVNLRRVPAKKVDFFARKKVVDFRDEIVTAVLTGIYANFAEMRAFVVNTQGETAPLMQAFARIAEAQAEEVLRVRGL
jgi:uncharacterized circularly permuted ATP-grasp superfamily protein